MEGTKEKKENIPDAAIGLGGVLKIAWPAVFESFFISLAGMIDTLMVSGIGSEAVAAVGLTTQPKFLGLAVFIAMNVAVAAIVARRKGERNQKKANETLMNALFLTVIAGIVLSIVFAGLADTIMRLCGSADETHDMAVEYFRIIMGCMMFNIISMVINAAQRGAGNTKIAMYTNTISNLVNIIGNYLLIGGHCGFPALGIRGAAIATVFGTVIACAISILSLFRKDSFLSLPLILKEKLWKRLDSVGVICRLAVSTFVEQVLMRIGFMSTSIMAADMGTAALAAHQVGMNALSLSFSLGDGMQAAAVSLIGQKLGERKPQEAKHCGMLCEKIGIVRRSQCPHFISYLAGRSTVCSSGKRRSSQSVSASPARSRSSSCSRSARSFSLAAYAAQATWFTRWSAPASASPSSVRSYPTSAVTCWTLAFTESGWASSPTSSSGWCSVPCGLSAENGRKLRSECRT